MAERTYSKMGGNWSKLSEGRGKWFLKSKTIKYLKFEILEMTRPAGI
jgi:hypothetical protein